MNTLPQETKGCQAINLYLGSTFGFQTASTIDNDKINRTPFLSKPFPRNKLPQLVDLIKSQKPKKVSRDIYELTPKDDDLFLTTQTYITAFLRLFDQLCVKTAYLLEVPEIEGFPKSETGYDVDIIFRRKSGEIDAFYFSTILRYLRPLILPLPTEVLDDYYTPSPTGQAKQEPKILNRTKASAPGIGAGQMENFPDQDGSPVPEIKRPDHRILPTPGEKKKPKGKVLPWSVGWKTKYYFIPRELYRSEEFQKLSLGAQETYRVWRNFAPLSKGKSKNRYCEMGINQGSAHLKKRKSDMVRYYGGEKLKRAKHMGTSPRQLKRYLAELLDVGLVVQEYHGWPDKGVARYLVCVSWKQVKRCWQQRNRAIKRNKEREAKGKATREKHRNKPKPETL